MIIATEPVTSEAKASEAPASTAEPNVEILEFPDNPGADFRAFVSFFGQHESEEPALGELNTLISDFRCQADYAMQAMQPRLAQRHAVCAIAQLDAAVACWITLRAERMRRDKASWSEADKNLVALIIDQQEIVIRMVRKLRWRAEEARGAEYNGVMQIRYRLVHPSDCIAAETKFLQLAAKISTANDRFGKIIARERQGRPIATFELDNSVGSANDAAANIASPEAVSNYAIAKNVAKAKSPNLGPV